MALGSVCYVSYAFAEMHQWRKCVIETPYSVQIKHDLHILSERLQFSLRFSFAALLCTKQMYHCE